MKKNIKKIGIYAGTFDPIHSGHISFALQAMKVANLDRVYFLPERRPRHKKGVEHFAHRVAMIKQALRPYRKFGVLEFVDTSFTVQRTLPQLNKKFKNHKLFFLMGSDSVISLPLWPNYQQLLLNSSLIVGVRQENKKVLLEEQLSALTKNYIIIDSFAADVSSSKVREALRQRLVVHGVLQSVINYSNQHWLYVSFN